MKNPKATPLGRDPFKKPEPRTGPDAPVQIGSDKPASRTRNRPARRPAARPRVLLTGANGFVGRHLAAALVHKGYRVRCVLDRTASEAPLAGLAVEIVRGSLGQQKDVTGLCRGVQTVFHAACHDLAWGRSAQDIWAWNIESTRLLGREAVRAGVKHFVHTSSVLAAGRNSEDRDMLFDRWDLGSAWSWSLYAAELEALSLAGEGLRPVVVRSPLALGRGDVAPSIGGQLVLAVLRSRLPGYFAQGGLHVGLVQDIAEAHLKVLDKRTHTRVQVVRGQNVAFRDFLHAIERVAGERLVPDWPVSRTVSLGLARMTRGWPVRLGPVPFLTTEAVKLLAEDFRLPAAVGRTSDLLLPATLETMIYQSVQWYRDHGMV